MPKLFLHHVHRGERIEDHDGAEFPNVQAARREAIAAARELMADRILHGKDPDQSCVPPKRAGDRH